MGNERLECWEGIIAALRIRDVGLITFLKPGLRRDQQGVAAVGLY